MKEADVFLLDLHPACGLAAQLRRVLESIPTLRAHIFQPLESPNSSSADDLKRALADVKPNAIFLFWPPHRTADACRLVPFLRVASPGSRVVAVTEGDDHKG